MKKSTHKVRPIVTSRLRGKDGEIGEIIYQPETAMTAFAIMTKEGITTAPSWQDEAGRKYTPIPGANNLIRHNAVLLPSAVEECGEPAELVREIETYLARYVDLSPSFLVIVSHYILLSWVYDAFNELPYVRFRGEPGSGKTRALIAVGSLCYQSFMASGASTVSPIFHTLDAFRGTLVLDEADFRFSDEKMELVKIFNNGNVKGFPVFRSSLNAQKTFDPQAFHVYGPKIVAMRHAFEDRALESRFLTEEMSQRPARADIPINLPDCQQEEALALRNKLLGYRLRHFHEIKIDPTLIDSSLSSRLNQIIIPLLSIATSPEARTAIRLAAQSADQRFRSDRAQVPEALLLDTLLSLLPKAGKYLLVQDIAQAFQARFGEDFERPITARYVGSLLRTKLHLLSYKTRGVYVVPTSEGAKVRALAEKFGLETARE